jgi:telomerase Cajal body protein 1
VLHVTCGSRMDPISKTPTLVASTGTTYSCTIGQSKLREKELRDVASKERQDFTPIIDHANDLEVNYFKSAQW